MIKTILTPDQDLPLAFSSKYIKIFGSKQIKIRNAKYQEILRKNNQSPEILKVLSQKGCTYAFVTNIIINQFLNQNNYEYNDELFKETFGFSLKIDEENIDYNILMVDIFSALYDKKKFNISLYKEYNYSSNQEAAKNILKEDCQTDIEAFSKLTASYISIDGNNYKQFLQNESLLGSEKDIESYIKSYNESENKAHEKYQITYKEAYAKPESKFSGIGKDKSKSIETWVNFYLSQKNIKSNIHCKILNFTEYDKFIEEIKECLKDGQTIGVSAPVNSNVKIIREENLEEEPIGSNKTGHQMQLSDLTEDNDLSVESWGKKFIIKKAYFNELEFITTKIDYLGIVNTEENHYTK